MSSTKKIIAVIGATGNQGSGVVRALQARGEFQVRALTRNPSKYQGVGEEVIEADLNRPEELKTAFKGVYGVFAVTNFWENGTDEFTQATAAINAAKAAGVQHFVWSTLPNVEKISGGKFDVPHFTTKAKVDELVKNAGFTYHTFVIAPFFFQNLNTVLAPQTQQDGSTGWTMPIDSLVKAIHMGDVTELGNVVAGAFAHPDKSGNGQYLPLVGNLLSFDDIVSTLNKQGHQFTLNQVPANIFSTFFEGAGELAQMFAYFEGYTYLGGNFDTQIKLANELAGKSPTDFATWAKNNFNFKVTSEQ